MHPDHIDQIIALAFDGTGETTGSDEFGMSLAWLSHSEVPTGLWDALHPEDDHEVILAMWLSNGYRTAITFTWDQAEAEYWGFDAEYNEWLGIVDPDHDQD